MALVFVGHMNIPTYTALSTDIATNAITGASIVGGTVFLTDTAAWKIIKPDLTLADYVLPVDITLPGDLEIGAVEIKNSTDDTRATVGANGLAVDAYVNKIDQSVAESTTLSPLYGVQDVAVPGTAEPLAASSTKVIMALVMARATNVGNVYLGTAAVDKDSSKQMILAPGACVSIDAPLAFNFNLNSWYVDATNANDGVDFIAMR
jgi:hypothetical protein